MTKTELIAKTRELKELKIMLNELEAEIDSIEDEIKQEMTATGVEELIVDVFTIRYKDVKSNKFDSKAFKATYEELYNQYCKPTTYKRFTVN